MYYNISKINPLVCFLLVGSQTAFSGGFTTPNNNHYVVTISSGPVWASGGDWQTFYLQPDVQKTYTADDSTHVLASGELFLGWQHDCTSRLFTQLGLAVVGTTSTYLNGDVWEDADPNFNNFYYTYALHHSHVAIKGKVLYDAGKTLLPYISGSAGYGFNRSTDYVQSARLFQEVPPPPFASNTRDSFTYTAGVGIQKAFDAHWQIGAGYEFADWGKSALGPANGQTLNGGLCLNHIYTHSAQFNITYLS